MEVHASNSITRRPLKSLINGAKPSLFEDGEKVIAWVPGVQELGDTSAIGAVGNKGSLILTNRRILFMHKKPKSLTYARLENITSIEEGKFGLNQKLVFIAQDNTRMNFMKLGLHNLTSQINNAISARKAEIRAWQEKAVVGASIDLAWLKDYVQKGGLVLGTLYALVAVEVGPLLVWKLDLFELLALKDTRMILKALSAKSRMRYAELVRRVGFSISRSGALKRMEELGLVEKQVLSEPYRPVVYGLTAKGKRVSEAAERLESI